MSDSCLIIFTLFTLYTNLYTIQVFNTLLVFMILLRKLSKDVPNMY